ncbi:MAG: hypothetical protein IPL78_02880 [Chloroflexi bacterium]|nr:hypothetical protein [Chloroflexota bacterium]
MRYSNSAPNSSPSSVPPPIVKVWQSRPQTPTSEQSTGYYTPEDSQPIPPPPQPRAEIGSGGALHCCCCWYSSLPVAERW